MAADAEEGDDRQDSGRQHTESSQQGDGVALGAGEEYDGGEHEEAEAAKKVKDREVETVSHCILLILLMGPRLEGRAARSPARATRGGAVPEARRVGNRRSC